jgi:hypothetical protein
MPGALRGRSRAVIVGEAILSLQRKTSLGSPSMEEKDGRIVETAVEARGGRLGRPVLVVLIVSTLLVIGLFAAIYTGYFAG